MTHALNARPGAHPGHPPEELLIDAEVDDEPAPPAPPLRPWLLLLGLVLVALNLRPALSSLAPLLNQVRDDTGLSAAAAGLLGFLYAPLPTIWGWAVLLGLGQGGTFSIALALIVLRSRDAHVASHLSGMAQGVGYTLAAMGPFMVGVVHDLTGGWNAVGYIFIGVAIPPPCSASAPGAASTWGPAANTCSPADAKSPASRGFFSFVTQASGPRPSPGGVRGVLAIQSLSRL